MYRSSERGWREQVESAGLEVLEQRRLHADSEDCRSAGSLLTLCRRPMGIAG